MTVEIENDLFRSCNSASSVKELQRLLDDINLDGRHQLKLADPTILETTFYNSLSLLDQEILAGRFETSNNESIQAECFICKDGAKYCSEPKYSIDEGHVYLTSPVTVWVENSQNDSRFIKALMRHFCPEIPFDDWYFRGWLVFENSGGCSNAKNAINEELNRFQGKAKMLRCFVLLDGDKTCPTDNVTKYDSFIDFCNQNGITCHVLTKRSMENYMPDAVFDEFRSNTTTSWIDAYLYLSPEQKDFYNIAEGFNANIRDKQLRNQGHRGRIYMNPEVQQFYSSVSDINYDYLEQGLSISNFKAEFPKKFEQSPSVFATSLLQRTCHQANPNELYEIVNQIVKLL